jgi:hypothetical protein
MLLRIVLFLGLGLVLAGFGAAGWQYWQSLPAATDVVVVEDAPDEAAASAPPEVVAVAPSADVAEPGQVWLISKGGGLVPRRDARAFLQQGKYVEDRALRMALRLPLTALLSDGEGLPGTPYLEAFAEVRASVAGARVCAPLLAAWAAGCAVQDASLREGGFDPATMTAIFDVTTVFTLKPEAEPLPDLSTRVFIDDPIRIEADQVGAASATPEDFLTYVVKAVGGLCQNEQAAGHPCRVLDMTVGWTAPGEASATVRVGRLGPLPKGLYPAPPLF